MAFELHRGEGFPGIAASVIQAGQAVAIAAGDTQRAFYPNASNTVRSFGVALATAAAVGDGVTVLDAGNVVKVPATASVGAGTFVGPATTGLGYNAVASGSYAVGQTLTAAVAGEVFSLYVNPTQFGL